MNESSDDAGSEHLSSVLDHFGVAGSDLLGTGGESKVYALDEDHILRVYGPGTTSENVLKLANFYSSLDRSAVDFEVPSILESKAHCDLQVSIEPRLAGKSLESWIADLNRTRRRDALDEFVDAVGQIRRLLPGSGRFGELLVDNPLKRTRWSDYLIDRANQTLLKSRTQLTSDVEGLDTLVEGWSHQIQDLEPEPHLVHGDYFPWNVLVDDAGHLTAVIDFSPMTVIGDWQMDVAGAKFFLELGGVTDPDDRTYVEHRLKETYSVTRDLIRTYETYYALYFSATKHDEPRLYEWCVASLKEARDFGR